MDKEKVRKLVEEYAKLVISKMKVNKIILYGSYARGDYRANSDIDVAVVVSKNDVSKEEKSASKLTEEEVKSIAFQDAGVEEANVTGIRIHQEYDDGREKYEIDFYVDNREYDYDIDSNLSPFRGNNDITSVVVSEGVTSIGDYLFGNCQNMEKISLPTTLTSIGHAAFMQGDGYVNTVYGLTEITIPSGVTSIGGSAFWGSAIQSLVIPASVTEIGKYACRDCAALKSVTINGTVIGEYMFVDCTKFSTFNIGSKLKKIGSNVFNYCSALRTITYDGTLAQWQAIEKGSNWDGRSAMDAAQSGLVKIQCTDGYMEYADGAWNEVKA